jgi:hypothetical protein
MKDIKEVALKVARQMGWLEGLDGVALRYAKALVAELQKDATPACYVSSRALEKLAYGDDSVDTGISAMRVFLSDVPLYAGPQPKAATVPQGWKLLPIEPTNDQLAAMADRIGPELGYVLALEAYTAAISAAPSLPAQSEGEQK